jgi:hypothetical protein
MICSCCAEAVMQQAGGLLRADLGLEPAAQRMGQRQKDFGLQVLMAKA